MRSLATGVLACLLMASGCAGGKPRDAYPYITGSLIDSVEGELEPAHLSILGIAVWHGTLQDVRRDIGDAKSVKEGRREFVCYLSTDPADSTAIAFETNELGGPEKTITMIVVAQEEYITRRHERCVSSDKIHHGLATDSGIKLGLAMSQLESLLGPPTHRGDGNLVYNYNRKHRLTDEELTRLEEWFPNARDNPYADVTTRLEARFHNGQLAWFLVHKVETY